MNNLRDAEWAWLAGFIDGEGWFGLYPYGKGREGFYRCSMGASNTHIETTEYIKELTGVGRLHYTEGQKAGWSPRCLWNVAKAEEIKFIANGIFPYVQTKLKQCGTMLVYLDWYVPYSKEVPPQHIHEAVKEMVILNTRGVV